MSEPRRRYVVLVVASRTNGLLNVGFASVADFERLRHRPWDEARSAWRNLENGRDFVEILAAVVHHGNLVGFGPEWPRASMLYDITVVAAAVADFGTLIRVMHQAFNDTARIAA